MREQMFLEEAESPGAWEAEEITHAGTQWYSTPAHTVTHPVLQKPPEGLQKGQDKAGSSQSTTPLPCSSSPKCTPKAPTRRHNFSRLLLSAATAEMDRNLSSRIFLPVGNWKATLSLFGGKGQTEALHCFLWVQWPSAWSHSFHQLRRVPLGTPAAGFSSSQRSGQISR